MVNPFEVLRVEQRLNAASLLSERVIESERQADPGPQLTLREFFREAWPVCAPGRDIAWGWYIDAVADFLSALWSGDIRHGVLNMPFRHGKSTMCSVMFPAWGWTQRPEFHWLFGSHSKRLAERDSVACRRLIRSQWFTERWGHRLQLAGDQDTKGDFDNTAKGKRMITSVGAGTTGFGGDGIVYDDPQSAHDATSEVKTAASNDAVIDTFSTRTNDPNATFTLCVQQRLRSGDTTDVLMDLDDRVCLRLPMEYNPRSRCVVPEIDFADPRSKPGELLCLERVNAETVAALKKSLHRHFQAQANQDPEDEGGGMILPAYLPTWSFAELPTLFDRIFTSWDLTMGKRRPEDRIAEKAGKASWAVGQAWGVKGARFYLLDQVRGQWRTALQLDMLVRFAHRVLDQWGMPSAHVIEDAALGPTALDTLGQVLPGIQLHSHEGRSKVERLDDVLGLLAAGQVFLPPEDVHPWAPELRRRLIGFPGSAPDDEVDALSQALRFAGAGALAKLSALTKM